MLQPYQKLDFKIDSLEQFLPTSSFEYLSGSYRDDIWQF